MLNLFLLLTLLTNPLMHEARRWHATENLSTMPRNADGTTVIHVFVALCDNKYQGIVMVPEKIGNGQDPGNNLYWGCRYGISTWFKKSIEWKLLSTGKPEARIHERLVFRHSSKNAYLVADAWDGMHVKPCTVEFLQSCSGQLKDTVVAGGKSIGIYGNADLVSYIGHDGLMDFGLTETFNNADGLFRDCIILACYSKNYFSGHLAETKATPLIWTTGLMCPEAYTLHDAVTGYVNNETDDQIRTRAALAYSKFQKCSEKAARNLLVSGW